MASADYYTHLARTQIQRLDASRAQALADLAAAKANSDYDSAGLAVQELADIEAKKANVVALHEQYVRSQTPVEAPELSQEEKHAKPIERMDYADVYEMANTSKYGVDENLFRAGMAEVQRRRAKGE
jgi:hypothetical protein